MSQEDSALRGEPSYADVLYNALKSRPESIAIVDGDIRLTYQDVLRTAAQMADALESSGVSVQSRVAILSGNRWQFAVAQIAVILFGATYVPIHPLLAADVHATMLVDSGAAALLFDPARFENEVRGLIDAGVAPPVILALGPSALAVDIGTIASGTGPIRTPPRMQPQDLVSLSYTGGTTGEHKAVARTHEGMVFNALLAAAEWDWPQIVRFLIVNPMSHATGVLIVPVLIKGGNLVIEARFDPEQFLDAVETHEVTATFLVPTMVYKLLDYVCDQERVEASLAKMRTLETIIYGAAPISTTRLMDAIRLFGPRFMQLYGQTEAPNTVAVLRKSEHSLNDVDRLASCGFPLAAVTVDLIGSDGRAVESGQVGEICVRGPLVMQGYWNRPELTATVLRGGWLHTGDLARASPEGYLTIVGRTKDMIISGGFNLYAKEIEDAIMQDPAVSDCAVIGIPDPVWGEAVKAVICPKPDVSVDLTRISDMLRVQKGGMYVPKHYEIVAGIPQTALGKPDKELLKARQSIPSGLSARPSYRPLEEIGVPTLHSSIPD